MTIGRHIEKCQENFVRRQLVRNGEIEVRSQAVYVLSDGDTLRAMARLVRSGWGELEEGKIVRVKSA